MDAPLIIEKDIPLQGVFGRIGRPKGSGSNLKTLARMKTGDSLWEMPYKKAMSFKTSAYRNGIKIRIRRIAPPNGQLTDKYALWRL